LVDNRVFSQHAGHKYTKHSPLQLGSQVPNPCHVTAPAVVVPGKVKQCRLLQRKDQTKADFHNLATGYRPTSRCQTARRYHSRPPLWSAMIGISWKHAGLPAPALQNTITDFPGNSGRHVMYCQTGRCLVPRSSHAVVIAKQRLYGPVNSQKSD